MTKSQKYFEAIATIKGAMRDIKYAHQLLHDAMGKAAAQELEALEAYHNNLLGLKDYLERRNKLKGVK